MSATPFEMELLEHISRYGPIDTDTIEYDLDIDIGIQSVLTAMCAKKWLEGSRKKGYTISDRFQWLRDIE